MAEKENITTENTEPSMLKLSDYLDLTLKFAADPTPENDSALIDWLGQVQIRDYLPLKQKSMLMMQILLKVDQAYDAPGAAVHIEMAKVAIGMIAYCVNVENDLDMMALTMGVYDNIQMYGLAKAIKGVAAEDYRALCAMVDNALDIAHVKELADTAALFNDVEYDKWIDVMKQMREELTPEILEGMIAMGTLASPEFKDLGKALSASFVQQVNDEMVTAEQRRQEAKTDSEKNK